MALDAYFSRLLEKMEESNITNAGKDKDGFFEPTRVMLTQRLNLLKDLHAKPGARPMVKDAWSYVVEHAPPEWLVMTPEEKQAMKKILA